MIRRPVMLQDLERGHCAADLARRRSAGSAAWLVQRITGVGLVLFLLAHIIEISASLTLGQAAYEASLGFFYSHPLFQVFDLLVLAGLVLHTFNGIRLLLIDCGLLMKCQRAAFFIVLAASAAVVAVILWRTHSP
jgi:succinate dehydrogenase / fumarate reductase, cytochrome b subunit